MNKFTVDDNYIMWGFRYALGRRTGAVDSVVGTLKRVWGDLKTFTKDQIKKEIQIAIDQGNAGSSCDVKEWQGIINLD